MPRETSDRWLVHDIVTDRTEEAILDGLRREQVGIEPHRCSSGDAVRRDAVSNLSVICLSRIRMGAPKMINTKLVLRRKKKVTVVGENVRAV